MKRKQAKHTRSGCDLAERRVLLAVLHVEQRLCLAEAACDVVLRLVRLAAVNIWQFGCITDEQHRGCDTDHWAWYSLSPMQNVSRQLCSLTAAIFSRRMYVGHVWEDKARYTDHISGEVPEMSSARRH